MERDFNFSEEERPAEAAGGRYDEPQHAPYGAEENPAGDTERPYDYDDPAYDPAYDRDGGPDPAEAPFDNPEIVRVKRTDDPAAAENRDDPESAPDTTEPEPPKRRFGIVYQIVMGTILNSNFLRDNYRYIALMAIMLLGSIGMLFTSLSVYSRYLKLDEQVRILRDDAAELKSRRFEATSHDAVKRMLEERGIRLDDPRRPQTVVD